MKWDMKDTIVVGVIALTIVYLVLTYLVFGR
jgi:hypothetical protein